MSVPAVLLDLDGTLVDTAVPGAVSLTCRGLAATWPGLNEVALLAANGDVFPGYFKDVEEAWNLGRLSGVSLNREVWRRTLERCECDDPAIAVWAQERLWQHRASAMRLFPTVAEPQAA